jgi:sialate O-acetylesterase
MKNNLLAFFLFFTFYNLALANVTLPNMFSDNMVLQRNAEVTIWGWANPKEEVKITPSWNKIEYKIIANNHAFWTISIPTPKEGGPFTIALKGYNEITLSNIMIGEVWLCSGQSNMEMNANWGIKDGDEEAKKATYPNIRFFSVEKASAETPQNNLSGKWVECSPETMKRNSAVAYFFAQRVNEGLKNVPIGMIISAWGATPAEVWIPENVIQNNEQILNASKKITPNEYCPVEPARTFNSMINPLIGFKIAGVLWYQGESNVGSSIYDKTFASLITSWRSLWKEDFPFYFVQIAPYKNGEDHYSSVTIRDLQRRTLQIANTAMVVTSDISTTDDIHPKDKKSVGVRLANLALANVYKTNTSLVNGPIVTEMKIMKNKVVVSFDSADGMYFLNNKSDQFEIAGDDAVFYKAEAKIKNNTVILQSDKVKKPVKVRFAWENTAQSQLFNKANLPASSFILEY